MQVGGWSLPETTTVSPKAIVRRDCEYIHFLLESQVALTGDCNVAEILLADEEGALSIYINILSPRSFEARCW